MLTNITKEVNNQIKIALIERIAFLQKNPLKEDTDKVISDLMDKLQKYSTATDEELLMNFSPFEGGVGYAYYLGLIVSFTYEELSSFIKAKYIEKYPQFKEII
jgi:hypothetical protein